MDCLLLALDLRELDCELPQLLALMDLASAAKLAKS
jgi:IMP dehydrogenase/GMP reductase